MQQIGAVQIRALELVQNLHLGVVDRIGEIVAVDTADKCFAAIVIELLYLILPGVVKVDRLFMQSGQRSGKGYFRDHLMIARDIDHDKVVAGDRAQANSVGRISVRRPVPGSARFVKESAFFQETGKAPRRYAARILLLHGSAARTRRSEGD